MAGAEEEAAPVEEQQPPLSSSSSGPEDSQPAAGRSKDAEERPAEGGAARCEPGGRHVLSPLDQFKTRRFFVLRPGTLNQAIKDIEALVNKEVDGSVHSIWLMAEVDHWNNEKERLVLITDNTLLVFKYDFIMLQCEQIQKISLNFIDRISHGTFSFPKRSLLQ
ncbi:tumor protein p63-regulated gene 1-like protein [Stegastes partitus]|uniref:Tumor protein p63-regulated gene 1-like protein n=1 Tax=Stegastes partitus TaxID=144197 RepID=A0A9Y4JHE4_9TELE|nr:PREDICTED: tumor protein p63-regulated gene 1-like protein [Stegastes partitus]